MPRFIAQKVIRKNILVQIAAALFCLVTLGFLFIIGKPILAPLIFATLIAGLVYNIFNKINNYDIIYMYK